jgi:L-asparaginase II
VPQPELLAHVVRSGLEESIHLGHVAVCDADGRSVAGVGDPDRRVFSRSSMKPLQAAVSMSVAGEDDLTLAEIAVMCSSHNGETVHVDTVRRVLRRAALGFEALRCPPGWPLDPEAMGNAGRPRPELHNCSGKHAGKLLASVRAEWDIDAYLDPQHPLQQRILSAVLSATDQDRIEVGVDGCGAPVHAMPLSKMALLYARLSEPERLGDLGTFVLRATTAMVAEPYLVAGRDRLDTAMMEVAPSVVVKVGAEGLVCAAVLGEGIGIAVKIADGSSRAAGPALIEALGQIGVLDDPQVEKLRAHARPDVLGGGRPVGELKPILRLQRS